MADIGPGDKPDQEDQGPFPGPGQEIEVEAERLINPQSPTVCPFGPEYKRASGWMGPTDRPTD